MKKSHRKRLIIIIVISAVLISFAIALLIYSRTLAPIKPASDTEAVKEKPVTPTTPVITPVATPPAFDMAKYSTTDPASIWIITNKTHPLNPIDYKPADLVSVHGGTVSAQMEPDLDNMIAAAKAQGVNLTLASSYRSYSYQVGLYNSYVAQSGQAAADTYSARAGYSEHQTGLAIDFGGTTQPSCNISDCYKDTVEGKWLAANASTYGFLLRYTTEKQTVTGYISEPWHYRYVGSYLTTEMKARQVTTLEEFFNVSGGETYS